MVKKNHHISQAEYDKALAESKKRPRNPWAVDAVEYNDSNKTILLTFPRGVALAFPLALIDELKGVRQDDLHNIYLSPSGEVLSLDQADVHISTRGLIRDVFALLPKEIVASRFGSMGGAKSSATKKATSAENGKKGGRPKNVHHTRDEKQAA